MNKEIYFAGGCFWGVQKYFDQIKGVIETQVGYANGKTQNPTYKEVCSKNTGHAETVKVVYDKDEITIEKLLEYFYEIIDPTTINRQGPDKGPQYRSGIYYIDKEDQSIIQKSLKALQEKYIRGVIVEVYPVLNFYKAEEYHQKYLDKNSNGYCHIPMNKFEKVKKENE